MQELLKILEDFIKDKFNEETIKVFRQLWGKTNVSEFDIAENLKLSINYIRKLLYGLHAHNLVSSTRKKDRQKGWYIYYWTFNLKHAAGVILEEKKERIMQLEKQLSKGGEEYYKCNDGHVEFNALKALEHGFKCPECEQLLVRGESEHDKEGINAEVERIKKEIVRLEGPIEMPKEEKPKRARVGVGKGARKVKRIKKLKKIKRRIKKLKKRLRGAKPERKKGIIRKIKNLKQRRKAIKKKLVKKGVSKKPGKKSGNKEMLVEQERTSFKVKEDITEKEKEKSFSLKKSLLKKASGKTEKTSESLPGKKVHEKTEKKEEKKGLLSLIKRKVGF